MAVKKNEEDPILERIQELDREADDLQRTREQRLKSWNDAADLKTKQRRGREALKRLFNKTSE